MYLLSDAYTSLKNLYKQIPRQEPSPRTWHGHTHSDRIFKSNFLNCKSSHSNLKDQTYDAPRVYALEGFELKNILYIKTRLALSY